MLLGCGSGWLKKGSDVTCCDISVIFKLTCEITCTISCDFLTVYSKNPLVLVQSLAEVKFSPQGLLSLGKTHLPTSTSENHLSLAELSRNYRGTIKTSSLPHVLVMVLSGVIVAMHHCHLIALHHHYTLLSGCCHAVSSSHRHCPHCVLIVLIMWLHCVSGSPWLNVACVTKITATMNNDQCCHSSFGNVAPGFCINELTSEEGWVYSPGLVATHVHSWDLAVIHKPGSRWFWWAFIVVCGWLSSFVGRHLRFLAGHGDRALMGCSWHWVSCVVAIGSVVGLWLWLVEERSDVTSCDISVMFKPAHEITCTISCDFLQFTVKTPQSWSSPWQRWNSALRAGLSPAELMWDPPSNFYLWKPPKLGRAQQELQGDNKDLMGPSCKDTIVLYCRPMM